MGLRHSFAHIHITGYGQLADLLPGINFDVGGIESTPVMGHGGVVGYTEKCNPATIECSVAVGLALVVEKLQRVSEATITYQADTGQVWVIRNARCAGPILIAPGDQAPARVKLVGDPALEMAADRPNRAGA